MRYGGVTEIKVAKVRSQEYFSIRNTAGGAVDLSTMVSHRGSPRSGKPMGHPNFQVGPLKVGNKRVFRREVAP